MLKYEVKISDNGIKREEMVWREKYLSPNLSYISGVTSPNYHLENFDRLSSTNSIINTDSTLYVECKNVKRQGYVIVKDKVYDTYSGSTVDYSIVKSGETIDYQYLVNNDKYFYWGIIDEDGSGNTINGYIINNLLNYDDGEIVEEKKVVCDKSASTITIDTVYWIEDGEVSIDGSTYLYDINEGDNGILKYKENGNALDPSAVTRCSDIEFYPYSSATMYDEVTKFKLTKGDVKNEEFSKITFAKYFYYVKYKDHYCQVKQVNSSGGSYTFVCEIPLYLLSGKTDEIVSLETKEYQLYFVEEGTPDGSAVNYEESYNESNKINSVNLSGHSVYNLNDLKNVTAFIKIDEEEAYFTVDHDVLNGNDGNEIIVYLDNVYTPLNVMSKISFVNKSDSLYELLVYNSKNYSGVSEEFVIYNSKKYAIEKNIMDKVVINDNEYDVEYINGKVDGVDCLVKIGEEQVPMLIVSGETKLQRYGKIVTDASSASTLVSYDIKHYDGVVINGNRYIVRNYVLSGETEESVSYASLDIPKSHTFTIIEKLGNSTYVCEPYVNSTEFTDDFKREITRDICSDVVLNQNRYTLFIDNKIFGDKEITSDLPFIMNNNPTSSDDYYNLFDDLKIFVNNGYIHIPLLLSMNTANNIMQEDIVKRDFFDAKKKNTINPIVDMEKDVYIPKYIENDGMYSGSSTVFKTIGKINLNFHFRTRNLDSWKINDGNINYSTSGVSDNWFITDYHPYVDILKNNRESSGETLMQASDLMGLLYFTNDDIFYQKSKVGKSFARLSFYDSTDPQTQSLLATSCVFVDEHKSFKRFIDNSRKHEMEFGSIADADSVGKIYKSNKIDVKTEYLGLPSVSYETYSGDCTNVNIGAEEHRISSRLTIENKYLTDTSSEGFYIYMFREYSEKLRPKPIYMKIEFNHAGIGRTIPFVVPMHWSGNTTDSGMTDYNKMYPERKLTLTREDDEVELKKGIPLSYVYAQTYIPLYAVYDFNNKEYGYVFDSRYVNIENGVINLNLFEIKIQNESNASDKEREDIKLNRQERAVVNVNREQFDLKAFNYKVE